MKFEIEFHLMPEKPEHSCKCLCVQDYSEMFGFEFFDYSSKYEAFNVLDHQENDETSVNENLLAWAEVKPSKELLEWAGVFKRNYEKYGHK